jgi:hypothetical protein
VSTLLPFQPKDTQCVERKRHIGNDVVVLIFQDRTLNAQGGVDSERKPFDPLLLRSQFNRMISTLKVFLIVF